MNTVIWDANNGFSQTSLVYNDRVHSFAMTLTDCGRTEVCAIDISDVMRLLRNLTGYLIEHDMLDCVHKYDDEEEAKE